MTQPVTVIGLGPMGQALAATFAADGHPTTAWTRSATRPTPDGVARAATAAEAVTASKTVVVCLMDYDATRAVLHPLADALRGRHVVNLTSGAPAAAREMGQWAAAHGIDYTDGSIMTPTDTIGTPAAVILHSGQPTSALTALGGTRTDLGREIGRAAAYDVALLDLFWTSVAGVAHAYALAATEGIDPKQFAPLAMGIGALLPELIEEQAERLATGRHHGDTANLLSMASAMTHIVETSESRDIDASVMKAALTLALRAIDAGHGTDATSRLTTQLTG